MRQVLEMALEALEKADKIRGFPNNKKAITAIKEALAQPEQEPVAWVGPWHDCRLTLIPRHSHQTFEREQPLYTTPPQRKPLTDEQIEALWDNTLSEDVGITALRKITRAIEAAHGIKE